MGRPKLGADGLHLAAVLAAWKLSDEERFPSVLSQLKQIVPTLEDLRPNFAEGDKSGLSSSLTTERHLDSCSGGQ